MRLSCLSDREDLIKPGSTDIYAFMMDMGFEWARLEKFGGQWIDEVDGVVLVMKGREGGDPGLVTTLRGREEQTQRNCLLNGHPYLCPYSMQSDSKFCIQEAPDIVDEWNGVRGKAAGKVGAEAYDLRNMQYAGTWKINSLKCPHCLSPRTAALDNPLQYSQFSLRPIWMIAEGLAMA